MRIIVQSLRIKIYGIEKIDDFEEKGYLKKEITYLKEIIDLMKNGKDSDKKA
jgi:hypothetical protein